MPALACECQWWHKWGNHSDKLEWPFDKLVGVKGDIKVFIFEGELQQWDAIRDKYLAGYALLSSDEAFLALKFDNGFQATWWKPSRPGVHRRDEIIFNLIHLSA